MWVDFMCVVFDGMLEVFIEFFEGLVLVCIDLVMGLLSYKNDYISCFEYFIKGIVFIKYVIEELIDVFEEKLSIEEELF